MDPLSPDLLREYLPPDLPESPPYSLLHPGALFLFSERVAYREIEGFPTGRVLVALTNDGAAFLPLPPLPFFDPRLSPRDRGECLRETFSLLSSLHPSSPPPFLEGCPADLLPEGPFLVEAGEREVVLASSTVLSPRGNSGRAFRWENNRLERLHGPTHLRRIRPEDEGAVRALVADFAGYRKRVARDFLEREMASDMERSIDRARDPRWADSLEGWVLEGPKGLLAAGWYGRSASGRVLVGFLEARRPEVSNVGGAMMRKILEAEEAVKSPVEWINIGGGTGIAGVERAKQIRPHDRVLSLVRIRPV